jgi:hypothetical protein
MQQESTYLSLKRSKILFLVFGVIVALLCSVAVYQFNILGPIIIAVAAVGVVYLIFVFRNPKIGLYTLIPYCFLLGFFSREIGGIQYGMGIEVILILTWLSSLIYYKKDDWDAIKNDICLLFLLWFIFSILQVANPEGASIVGWVTEIRTEALYPILIIPLTFVIIKNRNDFDRVIKLMLLMVLIAGLNGIKQVHIGMFPGEQAFIDGPGGITHMIFGKMRAFSFYDAGQFGAFEASFVVMAVVLALGSSTLWKKVVLFMLAGVFVYAMLVSGTRGAFFALVVAAIFAIFLTKNYKVLFFGGMFMVMFFVVLKYTYIGSGIYSIQRFRSSVDPNDPSLIVRFNTQRMLKEYMSSRPFGGGLGVLGVNSVYNQSKWLSQIQPDSYWVKIWAMTGIVGLTLWFSMMMYILGKCCGIIWMIQNKKLQIKLIAVFSTTAGIFFCSYGNEVINTMPSLLVTCLTFALVYMGPKFDRQIAGEAMPEVSSSTTDIQLT